MLFVVSAVLFDMLKARQLACVSKSGQKCPAALSLSSWRAWIEIPSVWKSKWNPRSLSSWRAWIEISSAIGSSLSTLSLSSWRAWIEIQSKTSTALPTYRRSPHGERGLKLLERQKSRGNHSRSPHGERGLKCCGGCHMGCWRLSLSSWRAWIEISNMPNVPRLT